MSPVEPGQKALRSALRDIQRASSMGQVTRAVRAYAAPLGYDRFVMFSVLPARDELVPRIYWIEGDWFGDGSEVDAQRYVRHCPVTQHMLDSEDAFFWSKSVTCGAEHYRVVATPRGDGVHGLQVPVFGRTGLEGAVSLGGVQIDSASDTRLVLTGLSVHAFRAARQLSGQRVMAEPGDLSPREREVLRWVAAGHRQGDIAAALGLSARTVENHLRRARHRLGASTTAQAIRQAMLQGMLEVDN